MKIEKSLIVIPKDDEFPLYYKKSDYLDHIDLVGDCMGQMGFLENAFDNNIFLKEGCIEVQTSEDSIITLAVVYLPSSLSKRQYDYLLQMKDFFQKFKYFEVGVYNGERISITFDKDFPSEKKVDYFYKMIEEYLERRSLL